MYKEYPPSLEFQSGPADHLSWTSHVVPTFP